MLSIKHQLLSLVFLLGVSSYVLSRNSGAAFDVTTGEKRPIYDSAPVGLSIEFFAFPGYVQDVDKTSQCIANLDAASESQTRVRIGGTTQDRALYDPSLTSPAKFVIPTPGGAPLNLTYGPSFFDLAEQLQRPTVVGLNRRLNQLDNTIAAAKQAVETMDNLFAIELGNEPDLYVKADPIANNQTWTPALDAATQIDWQKAVSSALQKDDIIEAGVFLQPPKFSVQELAPLEQGNGTLNIVKTFADHAYPQSACGGSKTDLATLMDHARIKTFVDSFSPEVEAASAVNKPIVFGETNSATCGGGGISPTFGAAIWIADYVLQAVSLGYSRLYFHQGTIGNCAYCWWGTSNVFAPYYGAYFATSALSGMSSVASLDDGTTSLAAYALYAEDCNTPKRVVLINTDYYPNTTTTSRPSQTFDLSSLGEDCTSVKVKRLTAPYATSQQELGQTPTFGGVSFDNSTCDALGSEQYEYVDVKDGSAQVEVWSSEAVLVYVS
ncbi:uncharacterized protein I303_108716 [Kwoniella dejecticola CBS 10117]|uniref:Beta-glucuronidase C-terminal domain-containing protein n=1 Tax=Kwoniella dejecticola CBS 10117 TaxID=1296121 RepID=A0A1A5ZWL4_9TREE|nr:uncharacterized protein I303_06959 [Kwoniella dejecticola CBS 10117]OBR82200.1 hypothetical protein I303_06959 [Kwoniella dejecticola CBS 10117]